MAARLKLLDHDAGGGKRFGVCDAFVAQRIKLAGRDEGGRQARQIAAERRYARIAAVGR